MIENADEVGWTAAAFDFYAELARVQTGRVIPPVEVHQLAMVVKEPLGTIAAIVPWNYPLLLLAWKLAPALAAGNTVIAKPSELTPLATLSLAPLFEALPPGTVQLLAGDGRVGAQLVDDPLVDGIAFTGSTATGTAIAHRAIDRMARLNLEMGGKDALIVCGDVEGEALQIAAEGAAWAAYLNAGQVCTSTERIYVDRRRYDAFVDAFVAHARTLRVGDPTDPATDVGRWCRRRSARRRSPMWRAPWRVERRSCMAATAPATRAGISSRPSCSPTFRRRQPCSPRRRSDRSRRSCPSTGSARRSVWPTPPRTALARTSTRRTSTRRSPRAGP